MSPLSVLHDKKVGFIGAGNMAQALAKGFVNAGLLQHDKIFFSAPSDRNLKQLKEQGYQTTNDNRRITEQCHIIVLAVKPHFAVELLTQLRTASYIPADCHIISVVSGLTLQTLEKFLEKKKIIRAVPNTPALLQSGVTVFTVGKLVSEEGILIANALFTSVGVCEQVPERLINVCTGATGSGPAFVFLMIQAMSDGAVKMGLPRQLATQFAAHTFMGAAKMVLDTGKHPGVLQDEVASPGGTTIHGLHELELGGVRGAIMNAVQAAVQKADEFTKE